MDFQGLQNTVSMATLCRTRGMEGERRGSSRISKYSDQSDLKSIFQGLLIPGTAGVKYCLGSYRDVNKV